MSQRIVALVFGFALAASATARADFVTLNITLGDLYTATGTTTSDLLPTQDLLYIIADVNRNGFNPITSSGWVSGDDKLVRVIDSQYPSGTYGFSLASGQTSPGLLSRSLTIDLSQFGGVSQPIPIELVWFPGYTASTDLTNTTPAAGSSYGQFTRSVSKYGYDTWVIPTSAGNYSLDPLATPDLGGTDNPTLGQATYLVALAVPEPQTLVVLLTGVAGLIAFRRRKQSVA